jgi:putative Holliday junction resolvase
VTDALRIVANPLDTIDTPQLITFVKQYIARENVDSIVVGKPKNLNGEDSDSMRYLTPVINKLRKEVAPLPVTFFDERFTSVLAHRAMIDGGMHKMARRDKAVVDRISASIILNDFLNSQQNI